MTSKLKCPFCGEGLYRSDNCYVCLNDDCIFCGFHFMEKRWRPIIELKQALTQAKQDLEIARKALEEIRDETGEDRAGFSYVVLAINMKTIAENALEQIEHKD